MENRHVIFLHSKLKLIDYLAFFKRQDHSATLTASIASSNVSNTKKKCFIASSTI